MRLVAVERLRQGMRLALPVKDERGRLLVGGATELDEATIQRILRLGVDSVYVDDPRYQGLEFQPVVPEELVRRARSLFAGWRAQLQDGPRPCVALDEARRLVSALEEDLASHFRDPVVLLTEADAERRPAIQALNGARLALSLAPRLGLGRYAADVALGALVRDVGLLAPTVGGPANQDPLTARPADGHPDDSLACLQNPSL